MLRDYIDNLEPGKGDMKESVEQERRHIQALITDLSGEKEKQSSNEDAGEPGSGGGGGGGGKSAAGENGCASAAGASAESKVTDE